MTFPLRHSEQVMKLYMSLYFCVFFTGLEERNCLEITIPAFCEEITLSIQEGVGKRMDLE